MTLMDWNPLCEDQQTDRQGSGSESKGNNGEKIFELTQSLLITADQRSKES